MTSQLAGPSFAKLIPRLARGEPAFPQLHGETVECIWLKAGRFVLGKGRESDVVLDDPALAAAHAILERDQGGWALSDQQTASGTFINGQRIQRARLETGDLIHLGAYVFCFKGSHLLWVRQPASPTLAAIGLRQQIGAITLLDDISLVCQPGEFIGLLGPSGAGKTTLLDALSGQRPAQSGRVLLDGESLYDNFERFRQVLGYVPQSDLVHPELTCRQALDFVVRLRLPWTASAERARLVQETLAVLDLSERAEVRVGNLSGGQRKRVSVGVELVCRPAILFLDEPSSGLDPGAEARLMRTLRKLADSGKTIVCATHIMENVELFDKIALVVPGGKLAFFGTPAEALAHFGVKRFLDLYDRLESEAPKQWQARFRKTKQARDLNAAASEERTPRPLSRQVPRVHVPVISSVLQWLTLMRRHVRVLLAEPRHVLFSLVQAGLMSAVMCLVFSHQAVLGFLLVIAALWFGCSAAAQAIVRERSIYRRERMVNLHLVPYVLSKFLPLAGLGALQASVMLAVVHGLRGAIDTSIMLPTLLLASWNGIALGLVLSSLAGNADKATGYVPLVLLPQIIFAGVLIPIADMNAPTAAISHLAVAKWANQGVEIALFEGKTVNQDLLKVEGNVWPVWNLFPDHELRSDKGRGAFLKAHGQQPIRRLDWLARAFGVLALFVAAQLAAAALVLRRQDAL